MPSEHSEQPRPKPAPAAAVAPPSVADCRGLRFWPAWIAYGLMRGLYLLPPFVQRGLSAALGSIAWWVARRERRTTLINLRLTHPDWSERARRELGRRHFQSLAYGVFETGLVWFGDGSRLRKVVRIEGREYLDEAVARGRGVMLLGGHFTTNEIAAAALPQTGHAVSIMYKAPKNRLLHALALRHRSGRGGEMIPADRLIDMVQALKRGGIVLYAPDQRYDQRDRVTVPLFGVAALSNPGAPVVAKYTGCAVLPYFPLRSADGRSYVMRIGAPLTPFPSGDVQADVGRFFRLLETAVNRAPEQYLWSYKRYRPADGEPDPYRRGVARGFTPE